MTVLEDWFHKTADIPSNGFEGTREAGSDERAALGKALEVGEVRLLRATYRITAGQRGCYNLKGQVRAEIVQDCVVSLDPVVSRVSEELEVEFRQPEQMPGPVDVEREVLSLDDVEAITQDRIDVGHVIFEVLATGIDPYPRVPDVELEQSEAGGGDGAAEGPFAALSGWKAQTD